MSGTEKALIITAITALAVVLALARREPPPRLVGVRGTENQADQAEPENVTRVDDWLARSKAKEDAA